MRYLSQRYAMPYKEGKAVLTDIATEELGHLEIVASIVHQLTRGLTAEQLEEQGFAPYYVDHTAGIWPQAAGGAPFSAAEFQSTGDPIAPARIVSQFVKKNKILAIKGGFVEGKICSVDELNAFGELTSKNDLVAQVLGTMLAPISSLAFVLDQIRLQKEAPEAAAAAE